MPLNVQIITPEKLVLQTEADSVVVPAADGELGILPHHTPLLAQLQPGEIRLRTGDQVQYFAVSGGFVEVQTQGVSVFAETAEMAHDIDVERARQAAERAKAELRDIRQNKQTLAQAESALRRALVRLQVAEASARREKPHSAHR